MKKQHFIFSVFCLLSVFQATAQESLSLADALAEAMAKNYDIRIQQKNVETANLNNALGEAGYFPSLSLNLQQGNRLTSIDNPTSFLAGNLLNNGLTPGAQLNWTIFGGFSAKITKTRLAQLEDESQGNARVILENTLQAVTLGYYRAALEQERVRILREVLKLSSDRYNYVKLKKELGSAVSADMLLEEGNFLQDSTNLINQQLNFRNAVRDLNVLLAAEEINQRYTFSDPLSIEPESYSEEELVSALENNSNLQALYRTQKVLETGISLARAAQSPRIDLALSASHDRNRQDLNGARFAFDDPNRPTVVTAKTNNYAANFTVSFTLFNGGQIQRAIQRANISAEQGSLRLEQLKLSLRRDLLAALDLYNTRKSLLQIAQKNEKIARQNLELSEEKFKLGTINSFDNRIVQINYINAAFDALNATYNLIEARISLFRLTGKLLEE